MFIEWVILTIAEVVVWRGLAYLEDENPHAENLRVRHPARLLRQSEKRGTKRREISLYAGRRIRRSECGRKSVGLLRSK
jgi:hypothetical protein